MNEHLAQIAARQGGVFTFQQARAAGYSPDAIRHKVRTRQWPPLQRGVYTSRAWYEQADALQRQVVPVAAVIVKFGTGTVASHHTAAQLHGIDLLFPPPPTVAITRPPGSPGRRKDSKVHLHRAALPAHHVVDLFGVPVTSRARTAVDLARKLPFREGVAAVDSALRGGRLELTGLRQVLADCRNWPGHGPAARAVGFADPKAESVLESAARVLFHEHGLPAPATQVEIPIGNRVARVDFLWEEFGVIVEVDGLLKYKDGSDLREEKLRQEALERQGYVVLRLGWDDVLRKGRWAADRIKHGLAYGRRLRAVEGPAAPSPRPHHGRQGGV